MFATKNGIVKRTAIEEFDSIRKSGKIAIVLKENDELISVRGTCGKNEIVIGASNGRLVRFKEDEVRSMGRSSSGVKGIELDGAHVVGAEVVEAGHMVLIVTANGYGKKSYIDEYRLTHRGSKGVKALNLTAKNGNLAAILTVRGDEDLMVVTDKGMIIRTHLDQILTIGRDTQGVRVILLNEGQKVSNIAIVPRQEEENEEDFTNEFEDEYELDLDYKFMDENNQEDE
jgi:DNA gyrase subunit A